jgi:hypothetical protein
LKTYLKFLISRRLLSVEKSSLRHGEPFLQSFIWLRYLFEIYFSATTDAFTAIINRRRKLSDISDKIIFSLKTCAKICSKLFSHERSHCAPL